MQDKLRLIDDVNREYAAYKLARDNQNINGPANPAPLVAALNALAASFLPASEAILEAAQYAQGIRLVEMWHDPLLQDIRNSLAPARNANVVSRWQEAVEQIDVRNNAKAAELRRHLPNAQQIAHDAETHGEQPAVTGTPRLGGGGEEEDHDLPIIRLFEAAHVEIYILNGEVPTPATAPCWLKAQEMYATHTSLIQENRRNDSIITQLIAKYYTVGRADRPNLFYGIGAPLPIYGTDTATGRTASGSGLKSEEITTDCRYFKEPTFTKNTVLSHVTYCLQRYQTAHNAVDAIDEGISADRPEYKILACALDTLSRIAAVELERLAPGAPLAKPAEANGTTPVRYALELFKDQSGYMIAFRRGLRTNNPEIYARWQDVQTAVDQRIEQNQSKSKVSGFLSAAQNMREVVKQAKAELGDPLPADADMKKKLDTAVDKSAGIIADRCIDHPANPEEHKQLRTKLAKAMSNELDYASVGPFGLAFKMKATEILQKFGTPPAPAPGTTAVTATTTTAAPPAANTDITITRILEQGYCQNIRDEYSRGVERLRLQYPAVINEVEPAVTEAEAETETAEQTATRLATSIPENIQMAASGEGVPKTFGLYQLAQLRQQAICKALREYVKQGGALGGATLGREEQMGHALSQPGHMDVQPMAVPANHNDPALAELKALVERRELALKAIDCLAAEGEQTGMMAGKILGVLAVGLIGGAAVGTAVTGLVASGAYSLQAWVQSMATNTAMADPYPAAFDALINLLHGDSTAFAQQLAAGNPIMVVFIIAAVGGLIGICAAILGSAQVADEYGGPSAFKDIVNKAVDEVMPAYIKNERERS